MLILMNKLQEHNLKAAENMEFAKQQARQLLHEQAQTHIQHNAQDKTQAAAMIQQVQREAQGVIHEAHGAIYREKRERERERERENGS